MKIEQKSELARVRKSLIDASRALGQSPDGVSSQIGGAAVEGQFAPAAAEGGRRRR